MPKAAHKNGPPKGWQAAGHLSQSGETRKTGTSEILSVIGIDTLPKAVSDNTAAFDGQS